MGLLSALGRGAKSFAKHYTNTTNAGAQAGLAIGTLPELYNQMTDGVAGVDVGAVGDQALLGLMLGAAGGGGLGVLRGAAGALKAPFIDPITVHRAARVLRSRGVSQREINRLADDDIVKRAYGGRF